MVQQSHFDADDPRKLGDDIDESEDETPETTGTQKELVNEIHENLPGITITHSQTNKKKGKKPKVKSILDIMKLEEHDEDYEIDDLNMIGISAPKPK